MIIFLFFFFLGQAAIASIYRCTATAGSFSGRSFLFFCWIFVYKKKAKKEIT